MAELFYGENGFEKNTIDAWNRIKETEQEYDADLRTLEDSAEKTFETIINYQDDSILKAEELIDKNDELIDAYGKELAAVQDVYKEVKKLREEYDALYDSAVKAAQAAFEYQQKENEKNAAAAASDSLSKNSANDSISVSPSTSSNSTSTASNSISTSSATLTTGQEVTVKKSVTNFSPRSGSKRMYYLVPGNRFSVKAIKGNEVRIGDPHGPNYTANGITGWVYKTDLEGFRSGGYTGEWNNNDGRLAMLHQKELVLNAQDTENMLNAVTIMRSLAYSLGSSILAKMASISAGGNGYSGNIGSTGLEQNVHIQADFPNVKDAKEIEEALNNLVNSAAQRAFEK